MRKNGSDTCVNNRISTMVREYSNRISCVSVYKDEPPEHEVDLQKAILKMNGKCEYCENAEASTYDHFFPLVKNKTPTDACNDFWNMVPSCATCNSSKGGRDVEQWMSSNGLKNPFRSMSESKRKRIAQKLRKYKTVAEKYRYKKDMSAVQTELNELIEETRVFFNSCQERINRIHKMIKYIK
jgi:5-methylcytosine-specific restriction endonuclease McrA